LQRKRVSKNCPGWKITNLHKTFKREVYEEHKGLRFFSLPYIHGYSPPSRKERQEKGKRRVRNLAAWRLGGSPRKVT
jgi:hypothetical protein